MTERIKQHIANTSRAVRLVKDVPSFGRELALVLTHIQEAQHLFKIVLRELEQLGITDKPLEHVFNSSTQSLEGLLALEVKYLRATALSTFEYSGSDKDRVLHLQSLFTTARIHVEQALAWVDELNGKL